MDTATMDVMTLTEDGRRARGATSRALVMEHAVNMASVGGLEGLSIGSLASEAAMSKGGVVALFGTKLQLQLATVEAARQIFVEAVIEPALAVTAGKARLLALLDNWLRYSESRVFSGGCFFYAASAEFGSRPGPVRDAIADAMAEWQGFVAGAIRRAIDAGELTAATDPEQLAFEVTAVLDGANSASILFDSADPYARARVAIKKLVE